MTDTKRLREIISSSGYKMGYLADTIGISRVSLNSKIENKKDFKAKEIEALSGVLGISNKDKLAIFFAK